MTEPLTADELAFERIDHIPGHKSPPDDGITYMQIDRKPYRVLVGIYTGADVRAAAEIGEDRQLWRIVPGRNDELIEDDTQIVVRNSGFRFFTTPRYINAGQDAAQPEPDTGGTGAST